MRPPSAEALLVAWERGRDRHPIDRAVLLHALAAPEAEPDRLADEPLGRRNAALLRLRQATFGRKLRGYLDCPFCGARLQFEMDAAALLRAPAGDAAPVEVGGLTFRPPSSRDLAELLGDGHAASGSLGLLRRCLIETGEPADQAGLEPLLDRVETALERSDPWSDVSLEFRCAECDQTWTAPFDIAGFLWEELDAYAAQLLDDVHLLARAYGWSESEVFALSDSRRAAYLERVTR